MLRVEARALEGTTMLTHLQTQHHPLLPRLICWGSSGRGSESLSWIGDLLARLTPILQMEKQKSKWFPNCSLLPEPWVTGWVLGSQQWTGRLPAL